MRGSSHGKPHTVDSMGVIHLSFSIHLNMEDVALWMESMGRKGLY